MLTSYCAGIKGCGVGEEMNRVEAETGAYKREVT